MSRVFSRQGAWWIDFVDANGKRIRRKIGPNKRIAREVLDGYLGKVAHRQHLGIIEDSTTTFESFCQTWWQRCSVDFAETTRARWWAIVEVHLVPAFPGQLRGITPAQAQSYVNRRLDAGAGHGTVNVELRILKHIIRRAVAWEYLSRNPLLDANGDAKEGLKALKEPAGRVRYLTEDEIDALLAAAADEPYLHQFVIVALNSGMRRSEFCRLPAPPSIGKRTQPAWHIQRTVRVRRSRSTRLRWKPCDHSR